MDLKNSLLLVVALLNLMIGFYVYSKNWKSQLRLSFLLLTIGVALWCTGLYLSNHVISTVDFSLFWSRFTYVATSFIAFTFIWLTQLFPFDFKLELRKIFLISIPFFAITLTSIIFPSFIIIDVSPQSSGFNASYNITGHIIFSFYFLAYLAVGFYYLIKRYLMLEGILKKNIKLLLIGLSIGAIFGIIFDLILPFGNYWKLNWLGPYFSLVMVFSVAYIMIKK